MKREKIIAIGEYSVQQIHELDKIKIKRGYMTRNTTSAQSKVAPKSKKCSENNKEKYKNDIAWPVQSCGGLVVRWRASCLSSVKFLAFDSSAFISLLFFGRRYSLSAAHIVPFDCASSLADYIFVC